MTTLEPVKDPQPLSPTVESSGPYDPEMKAAGQLTSPTWELELFLSGAFVFATFQLPGLIERLYVTLDPHATDAMGIVLFMGALYGKAIAFTLMTMFLVHLIARAYWVALLGLQSVFPRGINWPQMNVGPIGKDLYQTSAPRMSRIIASLDNVCSVVFSVGLLIVFVFLFSTLFLAAAGALAYGMAVAFNDGQRTKAFFYAILSVFLVVTVGGVVIDRRYGARLAPSSRAYRAVRGVLRVSYEMNLMRLTGPIMWTLMTNVGRRRATILMYIAIFGLVIVSAADRLVEANVLSINSYDYFGTSRSHEVAFRFYENQREPGKTYPRSPSIQSDIIRDPYVRLFIPYSPRRHNAVIARDCPGMKPLQSRGLRFGGDNYMADSVTAPVLACIAKIHSVTLDGVPRRDLEFSFYQQPVSGLKGVITYIPAESLSRGRHVIGVLPVPPIRMPTDSVALRNAEWKKPTQIPFWR